jgi:hypothetical protein
MPIAGRFVDAPDAEGLSGLMHLGGNVDRLLLPKHSAAPPATGSTGGAVPAYQRPCPASVLAAWPTVHSPAGVGGVLHVTAGSAVQLADASVTAVLERSLIEAMMPRLPRRLATHADSTVSFWCRTDGRVYEMLWCTQCQPLPVLVGVRVVASDGLRPSPRSSAAFGGVGDVYLFVSSGGGGGDANLKPHGRRVGVKAPIEGGPQQHRPAPPQPAAVAAPRPPTPPRVPHVVPQTPKRTIFRGRLGAT